jgi:DNA polymerase zeta
MRVCLEHCTVFIAYPTNIAGSIPFIRSQIKRNPDVKGNQTPKTQLPSPGDNDGTIRPMKKLKLKSPAAHEDIISPATFFSSPSPFTPFTGVVMESVDHVVKAVRQNLGFRTIKTVNLNRYIYEHAPPTTSDLIESLGDNNVASKIYRAPYYSRKGDVPDKSREYAGLVYHIKGGDGIASLEGWKDVDLGQDVLPLSSKVSATFEDIVGWEYASHPPSVKHL